MLRRGVVDEETRGLLLVLLLAGDLLPTLCCTPLPLPAPSAPALARELMVLPMAPPVPDRLRRTLGTPPSDSAPPPPTSAVPWSIDLDLGMDLDLARDARRPRLSPGKRGDKVAAGELGPLPEEAWRVRRLELSLSGDAGWLRGDRYDSTLARLRVSRSGLGRA